jgi:site-specific recombinase XerD
MLRQLNAFQKSLTLRGLTPSTIAELTRDLTIISEFLTKPLPAITQADLETALLLLKEAHSLKNVSLNRKISALRLYFLFLHQRGVIAGNPTESLSFARRIKTTQPSHLTKDQVQKLLSISRESPTHHTIIRTLYELGLRPSELISLQISDVDSTLMQIKVTGKGRRTRYIPFSPELLHLLRQVVRTHKGYRTRGPLFVYHDGSPLTPSFLQNIIAHYTRVANLRRRVSPKVFRHTHATHCLEAGVDLFQLRNTLGHSDLATTLKYTHITGSSAHKAHQQFLSYAFSAQAGP